MRPVWLVTVSLGLASIWIVSPSRGEEVSGANPWHLLGNSAGVQIYSRYRPGSSFKQFKAVGSIDAPTHDVHNVLNDVNGYPKFMPFIAECRILKRDGNSIYAYQRISPKIVSDRDYILHIVEKSSSSDIGPVYRKTWQATNELGPPEKKGVVRVKVCEGSWLLEPESRERTRATYTIYTDNGGTLPIFLANVAGPVGIRKIFAAVRKQVKDPKYRSNQDFLGGVH